MHFQQKARQEREVNQKSDGSSREILQAFTILVLYLLRFSDPWSDSLEPAQYIVGMILQVLGVKLSC